MARARQAVQQRLVIPLVTAVSQADVVAFSYVVGSGFKITKVKTYVRTKAGTVTADVKIGSTSVLSAAAAFTDATEVTAGLKAELSRFGKPTDAINVHFTTDGTGALTNGFVVVELSLT